ncbi:MAG: UbiA family prenyltransferase [Candidatus Micrarchaeaceae archaeon]
MLEKAMAFARLTRIEHSFMLIIAVIAGEEISGGLPSALPFLLSLISPVMISMAAFAINDYFDVEVDKENGEFGRPIVAGQISRSSAFYSSLILFLLGCLAALFINLSDFFIAAIFAILAFLYSYKLKEMLLLGNMYVAFSMSIPFIFGNYAVSTELMVYTILISLMIFAGGLAREIHGTIRDYEGDIKKRGVKSLPYYIGIAGSAYTSFLLYLFAIFISIMLVFVPGRLYMNMLYLLAILFADILLAYVGVAYLRLPKEKKLRRKLFKRTRNLSLFAMAFALFIYLLACAI